MRLVAVTGGKGGPGATTLAVGLAGAWAAAGQSVLLVDLDPAGGDVAAHLPVADMRRGVAPLLGSPGVPPGPTAVLAVVAQVSRRVGLLAGLARPDAAGLLHRDVVHALLAAVRRIEGLGLVVIDPGRLLPGSVATAVLEAAGSRRPSCPSVGDERDRAGAAQGRPHRGGQYKAGDQVGKREEQHWPAEHSVGEPGQERGD